MARRLLEPLFRGPVFEWARDLALLFSARWQGHLGTTQARNAALVDSLCQLTEAKVVVDSSKLALRLKYLLKNPALDIKVIRLIRDGRAVALTYLDDWNFADASIPSLRGGGNGHRKESPRQEMADAAREWKRSNEAADCLVARLPRSRWIEVRYENLCNDPEAVLRGICEFLGIKSDRINLNFRAQPQHVIGNGMRFDSSCAVRLDERWRTHLKKSDLDVFERVAGELNRQYGYG